MPNDIQNPFNDHEIIFKDKDGKLKVLKDGNILDGEKDSSQGEKSPDSQQKAEEPKKVEIPKVQDEAMPMHEIENSEKNPEREIADIIERSGIAIQDESLKKRLSNIIISRFKGVRDVIETRETLLRDSTIGGMGFSENVADAVVKIIEDRHNAHENKSQNVIQEIPLVPKTKDIITVERQGKPPAPRAEREAKTIEEKKNEFTEARKDILKLIQEMPDYDVLPGLAKSKLQKEQGPVESQPGEEGIEPPPESAQPEEKLTFEPFAKERQKEEKKVLEPIKPEEKPIGEKKKPEIKLVGPVDELREIDVTEFHRINPDPVKACDTIKKKLETLEKYSFAELARGIAAWRQSAVYKLYADIGRASIIQKAPIEQVISALKSSGKPHLTVEEFNAIMDLNEKIRF